MTLCSSSSAAPAAGPASPIARKPLKNSLLLAFQYRPAKAVLHESIAYALDSCRVIPAPEKTSSFFRGFLRNVGRVDVDMFLLTRIAYVGYRRALHVPAKTQIVEGEPTV